jgi:predicted nuclease of predicted toxin-antitoxin system
MRVRVLANESIPVVLAGALREAQWDVEEVRLSLSGALDTAVLTQAIREQRVLLTFDKDFGELAQSTELPASCGIILLRINGYGPRELCDRVLPILLSRTDWTGYFWVVEPDRIRSRQLTCSDQWA